MRIDDNFSIETDGACATLVRTEYSVHDKDIKMLNVKKGDPKVKTSKTYHLNVEMALKRYLSYKIDGAESISDIVNQIDDAMKNITKLCNQNKIK